MKSSAKKIELASVDDLFSTEEGRQDAKLEKIQEIPLSELHPFRNHPFKVKDDEAMMETADSIKQYGVLVPAIARPDPEGGYELVAGHRRHRASELAEKETMPVIVRDLDDDAATIIMVDSNLQRESLLPSERAFAYKMKLEAKHCEYKAMLKKTDIEPMVIEAIREIVRNEEYAQAIKKRIGVQIDTKAVDKELEGYQAKLKEVDLNKTRLEREIDSLPADAKYRERKLHDMTLRLDSLYDVIVELEEKIEDARLRRDAIKQQAITLENIYKIMVNFDCVYNIINDEEKRNVVTALIKEIEIYRNDESEYPLKRIGLNFPVFKDGGEVTELLWDKGNTVETVCLLSRKAQ